MTHKEESLLNNHHQAARGAAEPNQPGSMRSKAARTGGTLGRFRPFLDSWKNGRAHDELKEDHIYQRAASRAPTVTSSEELSSKAVRLPAARSWPRDKISKHLELKSEAHASCE